MGTKVDGNEGDKVRVGTPTVNEKARPEIRLVSLVSGGVTAVNRG